MKTCRFMAFLSAKILCTLGHESSENREHVPIKRVLSIILVIAMLKPFSNMVKSFQLIKDCGHLFLFWTIIVNYVRVV